MRNVEARDEKQEKICRHYWIIDSPEGSTSRGVCKFCGATKEFYNSWPGFSTWAKSSSQVPHPKDTAEGTPDMNERHGDTGMDEDWADDNSELPKEV